MEDIYFGTYARFETVSKKDSAQLLGADCLVGDTFAIVFQTEEGKRSAWLKNRFGNLVGYFDQETSRNLSLCEARGWQLQAILSFVAYTDTPDPGHYWGEVALICYDPAASESFDPFVTKLSSRMAEGMRPEVKLGVQGVEKVLESKGTWSPTKYVPLPEKAAGTALLKTRRSISEKVIEQARKGNKGCYFASWVILLAVVTGIIFGLKSCGVF